MKSFKLLLSAAVFTLLTITVNAQVNQNQAIGQAKGAAAQCLAPYHSNYHIHASFQTINCVTAPCPFAYSVAFFAEFKCHGNQICPALPIRQVAEVFFDSDGNIVLVRCN